MKIRVDVEVPDSAYDCLACKFMYPVHASWYRCILFDQKLNYTLKDGSYFVWKCPACELATRVEVEE